MNNDIRGREMGAGTRSQSAMTRLRRMLAVAIALAALIPMLSSASHAKGSLDAVASFNGTGGRIDVDTYTDGVDRVGLVTIITTDDQKISLALGKTEWPQFVELWRKAAAAQGGELQEVGDMTEVGTKDPTHVVISSGPHAHITLSSPALGSHSFDLSRSDFNGFGDALHKVNTYLAGSAH